MQKILHGWTVGCSSFWLYFSVTLSRHIGHAPLDQRSSNFLTVRALLRPPPTCLCGLVRAQVTSSRNKTSFCPNFRHEAIPDLGTWQKSTSISQSLNQRIACADDKTLDMQKCWIRTVASVCAWKILAVQLQPCCFLKSRELSQDGTLSKNLSACKAQDSWTSVEKCSQPNHAQ